MSNLRISTRLGPRARLDIIWLYLKEAIINLKLGIFIFVPTSKKKCPLTFYVRHMLKMLFVILTTLLRDHPFITSVHFWTFSDPPNQPLCLTVLNELAFSKPLSTFADVIYADGSLPTSILCQEPTEI